MENTHPERLQELAWRCPKELIEQLSNVSLSERGGDDDALPTVKQNQCLRCCEIGRATVRWFGVGFRSQKHFLLHKLCYPCIEHLKAHVHLTSDWGIAEDDTTSEAFLRNEQRRVATTWCVDYTPFEKMSYKNLCFKLKARYDSNRDSPSNGVQRAAHTLSNTSAWKKRHRGMLDTMAEHEKRPLKSALPQRHEPSLARVPNLGADPVRSPQGGAQHSLDAIAQAGESERYTSMKEKALEAIELLKQYTTSMSRSSIDLMYTFVNTCNTVDAMKDCMNAVSKTVNDYKDEILQHQMELVRSFATSGAPRLHAAVAHLAVSSCAGKDTDEAINMVKSELHNVSFEQAFRLCTEAWKPVFGDTARGPLSLNSFTPFAGTS